MLSSLLCLCAHGPVWFRHKKHLVTVKNTREIVLMSRQSFQWFHAWKSWNCLQVSLKTSRGFMLVSVLLPLTENVQCPDVLLNIFSGFMLTNVETLSWAVVSGLSWCLVKTCSFVATHTAGKHPDGPDVSHFQLRRLNLDFWVNCSFKQRRWELLFGFWHVWCFCHISSMDHFVPSRPLRFSVV